jgi:hypothetical protein
MTHYYHYEETLGQYRDPTEAELEHALAMQKERAFLNKIVADAKSRLAEIYDDKSKVFYDTAGHPYDIRHFIASGKEDLI